MQYIDLIWTLVSLLLTLLVFSYLFGDNPLFRLVLYTFIGISSGYVVVLVIYQVLLPKLILPLLEGAFTEHSMIMVPTVLSVLLLTKLSPKLSRIGSVSMAYLVGVGAAVAIGGAVMGTLVGQTYASLNVFNHKADEFGIGLDPTFTIIESSFLLLGTVTVLIYFHFGASRKEFDQPPKRSPIIEGAAKIGQIFIAITLGALFANVYAAALPALIERLDFILNFVNDVIINPNFLQAT